MQGNDLGSHWSKKFVVIAEPALFIPKPPTPALKIGRWSWGEREAPAVEFELNRNMVAWISLVGRQQNIPTEIWTFIADDAVVELWADTVDRYAGNAIVGWQQWSSEEDAVLELRVDPSIHTVYDADPDRADRLWGMKAHRVMPGGAP